MKILDVGQCGFDGPRMTRLWQETLGAEVDCADTSEDTVEMVQSKDYDVVLVNRVLAVDESSGLEVIARLLGLGLKTRVMLVSDLPEAQDDAVRLGPGLQVRPTGFLRRPNMAARYSSLSSGLAPA